MADSANGEFLLAEKAEIFVFGAGRLWGVKFALERVANLPSELSGAARRIQLPKSQKVGGHLHNAASSFGSIGDEFEPLFFLLLIFSIFKVAKKK